MAHGDHLYIDEVYKMHSSVWTCIGHIGSKVLWAEQYMDPLQRKPVFLNYCIERPIEWILHVWNLREPSHGLNWMAWKEMDHNDFYFLLD